MSEIGQQLVVLSQEVTNCFSTFGTYFKSFLGVKSLGRIVVDAKKSCEISFVHMIGNHVYQRHNNKTITSYSEI